MLTIGAQFAHARREHAPRQRLRACVQAPRHRCVRACARARSWAALAHLLAAASAALAACKRLPRQRAALARRHKQAPRQSVLKTFDAMFVGRCPASLDVLRLTMDVSTSGGRTQITATVVIKCVTVVGRIQLQLPPILLACSSRMQRRRASVSRNRILRPALR